MSVLTALSPINAKMLLNSSQCIYYQAPCSMSNLSNLKHPHWSQNDRLLSESKFSLNCFIMDWIKWEKTLKSNQIKASHTCACKLVIYIPINPFSCLFLAITLPDDNAAKPHYMQSDI